jgi:hypothetical protein
MKRVLKIIGFFLTGVLVLTLLTSAYFSRENLEKAKAQTPFSSSRCDEIIPASNALTDALRLMSDTYDQLQDIQYYIGLAKKQTELLISDLYQDENVCDFSKCRAVVLDEAPHLKIKITPIGGEVADIHVPVCVSKDCIGDPCPKIEDYIKDLESFEKGISGSYQIIKSLYNNKTIKINWDIKKTGETIGDSITFPELVRRKLELVRRWLHAIPFKEGKRSCSLTKEERIAANEGEGGIRTPVRCIDALRAGIYWPKAWSEKCQTECKDETNKQCYQCLGGPKNKSGTSYLAKINYKIYGECGAVCQNELTPACVDCICTDENNKRLSGKSCQAWICGGDYYNWTCCHETTLNVPE